MRGLLIQSDQNSFTWLLHLFFCTFYTLSLICLQDKILGHSAVNTSLTSYTKITPYPGQPSEYFLPEVNI